MNPEVPEREELARKISDMREEGLRALQESEVSEGTRTWVERQINLNAKSIENYLTVIYNEGYRVRGDFKIELESWNQCVASGNESKYYEIMERMQHHLAILKDIPEIISERGNEAVLGITDLP